MEMESLAFQLYAYRFSPILVFVLLLGCHGPGNELGKSIDVNEAADHIFGLVLMNDWSGMCETLCFISNFPIGCSFGCHID